MAKSKILLIRLSSIGDIILTTPIIRCIKKQTKAEVHFLTKASFASLVEHNPYIDKIITFENNLNETILQLKKEEYHFIVDLHKNLRTRAITAMLSGKTYTYNKLNVKKWLYTTFKVNLLPSGMHLVERYFEGLHDLSIHNDGKGLDYFSKKPLDQLISDEWKTKEYIVLVLGATYFTKRIPYEKCQEIIKLSSYPVVLLGGKDVLSLSDTLVKNNANKVYNMCGRLSLDESAAFIQYAKHVITGDTGMMHIASALQVNITVIWGSTSPILGMYPYIGSNSTVDVFNEIVDNLSCQPCSKLGYNKCPKGHFKCMNLQDTDKIIKQIK